MADRAYVVAAGAEDDGFGEPETVLVCCPTRSQREFGSDDAR